MIPGMNQYLHKKTKSTGNGKNMSKFNFLLSFKVFKNNWLFKTKTVMCIMEFIIHVEVKWMTKIAQKPGEV